MNLIRLHAYILAFFLRPGHIFHSNNILIAEFLGEGVLVTWVFVCAYVCVCVGGGGGGGGGGYMPSKWNKTDTFNKIISETLLISSCM